MVGLPWSNDAEHCVIVNDAQTFGPIKWVPPPGSRGCQTCSKQNSFFIRLEEAGRKAKREYGVLASRYVEDFRYKWIRGQRPEGEPLLGTSDIQSLADLGNAYNVVSDIRLVPISRRVVLRLAVILIVPILPLTLTMVPLDKIVGRVINSYFD
jgi:hypothetical protein